MQNRWKALKLLLNDHWNTRFRDIISCISLCDINLGFPTVEGSATLVFINMLRNCSDTSSGIRHFLAGALKNSRVCQYNCHCSSYYCFVSSGHTINQFFLPFLEFFFPFSSIWANSKKCNQSDFSFIEYQIISIHLTFLFSISSFKWILTLSLSHFRHGKIV